MESNSQVKRSSFCRIAIDRWWWWHSELSCIRTKIFLGIISKYHSLIDWHICKAKIKQTHLKMVHIMSLQPAIHPYDIWSWPCSLLFSWLNNLAAFFSINQYQSEALWGEHDESVNSYMSGAGSRVTLQRYCQQTAKFGSKYRCMCYAITASKNLQLKL